MNPAVILIPTLILVSGLVAFVGNQVGRSIGRRRLAVLGLRPRYTAQLVTVLTGMLITVACRGSPRTEFCVAIIRTTIAWCRSMMSWATSAAVRPAGDI